ncbi:cysteine-rich CWC family protein [Bacillus sp. UMB0893]|uniref:cysteine-rich CWC family protein n=1 Tax=Bacillus sp. UMB0893 TaxID=2066053 RepID=UPI000C77A208|nr:hypothetical protein CYJ36_14430 [Bacillus sp. UMB0893]
MSKCPLCDRNNNCAISKGEKPESCWCMKVYVSTKLFENISLEKDRCFCRECIERADDS